LKKKYILIHCLTSWYFTVCHCIWYSCCTC